MPGNRRRTRRKASGGLDRFPYFRVGSRLRSERRTRHRSRRGRARLIEIEQFVDALEQPEFPAHPFGPAAKAVHLAFAFSAPARDHRAENQLMPRSRSRSDCEQTRRSIFSASSSRPSSTSNAPRVPSRVSLPGAPERFLRPRAGPGEQFMRALRQRQAGEAVQQIDPLRAGNRSQCFLAEFFRSLRLTLRYP